VRLKEYEKRVLTRRCVLQVRLAKSQAQRRRDPSAKPRAGGGRCLTTAQSEHISGYQEAAQAFSTISQSENVGLKGLPLPPSPKEEEPYS
jgi:hypothetical protein